MCELAGPDSGLYALLIELVEPATVAVGRLGRFRFAAGHYVYVGSAKVRLRSRLARHQRRRKRLRWHVDYLLRPGRAADAVVFPWRPGGECELVRSALASESAHVPVPGFGSSDCRCAAHLLQVALLHRCGWASKLFPRWRPMPTACHGEKADRP
ncbi:MAG: DUF123 domain-containing protein [Armatimonadota bacterium]